MKKLYLIFFPLIIILFLNSCEITDDGNIHITDLGWYCIIVFIVIFIFTGVKSNIDRNNFDNYLKKKGINKSKLVSVGTYVGGHPNIDNNIEDALIYVSDESFKIAKKISGKRPIAFYTPIPIASIKNISLEDSTTIDKKVTLGRVLLVGIFALAWKKNKKNEMAFVSIDWNDGRFDHSTLFSFVGTDATQKANTARNKLIRMLK